MYNLYDKVELKDGTKAIIIEKFSDSNFLFELQDSEEFMRDGTTSDIKKKIA